MRRATKNRRLIRACLLSRRRTQLLLRLTRPSRIRRGIAARKTRRRRRRRPQVEASGQRQQPTTTPTLAHPRHHTHDRKQPTCQNAGFFKVSVPFCPPAAVNLALLPHIPLPLSILRSRFTCQTYTRALYYVPDVCPYLGRQTMPLSPRVGIEWSILVMRGRRGEERCRTRSNRAPEGPAPSPSTECTA